MKNILSWIVVLGLTLAFPYVRAKPKYWLPGIAVVFAIAAMLQFISGYTMLLAYLLLLIATAFTLVTPLRYSLISKPLMAWFKRQQPALSIHEEQVLQAGGVWWEEQFFTGAPNWEALTKIAVTKLSDDEERFLAHQVEHLCQLLNDWEVVHHLRDLPKAAWEYIRKEKFWALCLPKEYGGLGFSANAHSMVIARIASRCMSAAITVMVPNSLGPAEFVQHYGTDQQKKYYLPRLASGEEIPCFALTAPEAGSDATSITDHGEVCKGKYEGQEVLGIKLNFDKRYITLAPVATLVGLAFKLFDPEHLLGTEENIGITLALVPAKLSGMHLGERHNPLNLAFMNGPVRGQDVFIPLDFVIGGRESVGQGWKMMMECLALGRGISLPSISAAAAELCFRMTANYAVIRRQFQRSIGEFEGVKLPLARMGGLSFMIEATRRFTAEGVTQQAKPSTASAIAKYHLTEMCRVVTTDAMDIHGGRGIQVGPNNYLGNLYSSIPIMATVEGANILTRNLIIYGQGVVRSHPYLQQEIAASNISNPQEAVKTFDRLLFQHAGFILQQFSRTLVAGVTAARCLDTPVLGPLANYYRQLTRMSSAFMFLTDVTLGLLGSRLKIKELVSARLGDILSHLYLSSAVLKYYADLGVPTELLPFVDWSINYSLLQMQNAIVELTKNYPSRLLGKLLRWIIFPWGLSYSYPGDKTIQEVAALMQHNDKVRHLLTSHVYVGQGMQDVTGRMDMTLAAITEIQPLLSKVKQAALKNEIIPSDNWLKMLEEAGRVGVLSAVELSQCQKVEAMRSAVIAVDEFK